MMNKMTYVSALTVAIDTLNDEATVERLTALRDTLIKRNSRKATGLTKNQKQNVEIKDTIKGILANAEKLSATEVSEKANISLAKATALLSQLVKSGEVDREVLKKKAYFSVA